MGRTDEGVFKETVEVALENKFDVALDALVNLYLSCIAVSSDCPLADTKPGDYVLQEDNRLAVIEKSRFVSGREIAGAAGTFLNERNVSLRCGLEIRFGFI